MLNSTLLVIGAQSIYDIYVWNKDFNLTIDDETWLDIWQHLKGIATSNRTRETQFKILHCLQITPQLRHKMNPNLTEIYRKI